jgi:hypothetical protein
VAVCEHLVYLMCTNEDRLRGGPRLGPASRTRPVIAVANEVDSAAQHGRYMPRSVRREALAV